MKTIYAGALLAPAILLAPATADAGKCGGGGGGSSGGGGGSSGGGSYDGGSSSSASSTPSCTDETDIVGYRRCTEFARWGNRKNVPAIIIELGTAVRSFSSPLGAKTGTLSHDTEDFTYRVVGNPSGPAAGVERAIVSTLRAGAALSHGFYIAAEGELGGVVRTSNQAEMMSSGTFGAPSITAEASLLVSGVGAFGVRGAAGALDLGAEIAGGVRMISYRFDSHYMSCETSAYHRVSTGIVEARARAGYWLTPFLQAGVSAGASVIDRGAWVGGVHFGVVTQAFGGTRD